MEGREMSEHNKKRILIVDDESVNIKILKQILSLDYNVSAATDGPDAIEAAEEILPDIILLDIVMPDMDGYTVISKLKSNEKTKDIPVIFLTAMTSPGDETKGFNLGASDYIFKPFSADLLLRRVEMNLKLIEYERLLEEKGGSPEV